MTNETRNYVDAIVEHTRGIDVVTIEGVPHALVPQGYDSKNLESLLATPIRHRGSTSLDDADSFVRYVNRNKVTDETLIYCSADYHKGDVTFRAVFNDHTHDFPGWKDFVALYPVPKSEEWKRWTGSDRKPMDQAVFATFIEDNLKDIAGGTTFPTGAQMLEMALSLEVNQDARYKSAIRLQSGGVDLQYVDQDDDATVKRMQLFERFALGIAPFLNGEPYQITARLRYRVKEGKCAFWYELVRPDIVLQDATKQLIGKISADSSVDVLLGRPA